MTVESKETRQRKPREPIALLTDPKVEPITIEQIGGDYIYNYCEQQGADAINWLVDVSQQKQINKNGKEGYASHFTIRTEFCKKYFPHLLPQTKNKKLSLRERALAAQKSMTDK